MLFCNKPKMYKNYIEDWESPNQIIVCENGIFKRVRVNSLCYIVKKTSFENLNINSCDIQYDYIGETPVYLEEKPYMKKKIPVSMIENILKFYQVYATRNLEVKLNIWYDKLTEEFIVDCPFQDNHTTSVTEIEFDHPQIQWTDEMKSRFPEKFLLKEKRLNRSLEKILETHSHHNMSCSFSGQDDKVDYYESVGYHLIGVYSSVLTYPTLHLRYFVSPYAKGRQLTSLTKQEDEVLFVEKDIIDYNSTIDYSYDFNMFAKHVGITNRDILI